MHLAWDASGENFRNGRIAPANLAMVLAACDAARTGGLSRLVLASSVHADTFSLASGLLDPEREPVPDSPYGASKVWMEAYGRHLAAVAGLDVVCIRFGGVNPRDVEPEDALERAVWFPHRDCVSAVDAALRLPVPASRYALLVAVGDNPTRVHAFSDDLPWRPERRPAAG